MKPAKRVTVTKCLPDQMFSPEALPMANIPSSRMSDATLEDVLEPRFFRPGGQTQRANRRTGAVFPIPEGPGRLVKE